MQLILIMIAVAIAVKFLLPAELLFNACATVAGAKTTLFDKNAVKHISIHYFAARGRAELIRLVLAESGVPFENIAYTKETWPAAKSTGRFPFGQVPAMEIEWTDEQRPNELWVQSKTIARHVARGVGLAGRNVSEEYWADVIADGAEDLGKRLSAMWYGKENTTEAHQHFVANDVKTWFAKYEALLMQNGGFYGGGMFFVGVDLTWADLAMYDVIDAHRTRLDGVNQLLRTDFPTLHRFMSEIESRPNIAKYFQSNLRFSN